MQPRLKPTGLAKERGNTGERKEIPEKVACMKSQRDERERWFWWTVEIGFVHCFTNCSSWFVSGSWNQFSVSRAALKANRTRWNWKYWGSWYKARITVSKNVCVTGLQGCVHGASCKMCFLLWAQSQVSEQHWFRGMAAGVGSEREAGPDWESGLSSVPPAVEACEGLKGFPQRAASSRLHPVTPHPQGG